MNKTALKNFATSARRELLKKVEAKAMKIGITEANIKKADIESSDAIFIDGRQLSKSEKVQRDKLIDRIQQTRFGRVMEEVAYTWFNRFTALRFMEVNNYLPTKVRVLSSSNADSAEPDMMKEALSLDLDIDKEYVYELKLNNNSEELFKYLIIKHCNDLNRYMPFMFEKIDDFTEILFPEGLLAKDSFVRQMTNTEVIPEDNWQKVEIIGWLYQYYIAEEKDRVIKAKKKYKTEEIPFATQLFTPDWIVRYMVQNSLGRYWVESHPEHRDLLNNWEFYLETPNPEPDFEERLAPYVNKELKVEDIKCFDPAMGSGHILVYMFDVLYEIYSKCGYMDREIPRLIIENNLYGLDIDDRAYQLACFSVVMKALEYNKRFFRSIEREGLVLNLASIQETNKLLTKNVLEYLAGEPEGVVYEKTRSFISQFENAKTIGSFIKFNHCDTTFLEERLKTLKENPAENLFDEELRKLVITLLPKIINQVPLLCKQYDILVTNPPYMGTKYMNPILMEYIKEHYSDTKSDTFSVFMEYCFHKVHDKGQLGFLTPFVWMSLSSYESLRSVVVQEKNISSLIELEYNAFPEACVPVCGFTIRNYNVDLNGEYIKLSDFPGSANQPVKVLEAVKNPQIGYRYTKGSNKFKDVPGYSIVGYWATEDTLRNFKLKKVSEFADACTGMQTGNNTLFTRNWFEVEIDKTNIISNNNFKWCKFNEGGELRKWYGNHLGVVNWENDGYEIRNTPSSVLRNQRFYFKQGITWKRIGSSNIGLRYLPEEFIFDQSGDSLFTKDEYIYYLLGYFNSKVSGIYAQILSPTMNLTAGNIKEFPIAIIDNENIVNQINNLVEENIKIAKKDWDSSEISWDYKKHSLLRRDSQITLISESFNKVSDEKENDFNKIKENETFLNELFIDIFNLNNDLNPCVKDKDITIKKANINLEIKSFISYAVGCMFGRYSLDEEGLIHAGGEFNQSKYQTFPADQDNILPILPGAYFEDDIVSRIIDFVKATFGNETLSENLDFIANTLGMKKGETAKETIRRYFLNDFFKDHVQTYKKRPIYWLFTSGKQKAFNCLIYMHRYDKTTLSRIRTDYLHEYQIRLDAEKRDLLTIIEGDSTAKEISNTKKELKTLEKKIEELKEYDELLHHMADMQIEIDLDDGVAVNYEKFKGLLAPIK